MRAGTVFFSLADLARSIATINFIIMDLIITILVFPLMLMGLYANDAEFFAADVRSGLYRPSAYHCAHTLARACALSRVCARA